jgi:hypothetical protein
VRKELSILATNPMMFPRRLIVATDDVEALAKKLRHAHVGFVSTGIIVIPNDKSGFSKGTLVSDPDGHDLLLIQK